MISADLYIALSFSLSFGVPLVLACMELRRMGRTAPSAGDGRDIQAPAPAPAPAGDEPDLPPLPECLIPKPIKVRVLEKM